MASIRNGEALRPKYRASSPPVGTITIPILEIKSLAICEVPGVVMEDIVTPTLSEGYCSPVGATATTWTV